MNLILETPLNNLSFGNVGYNILKELHRKDINLGIFPTGKGIELSAFNLDEDLKNYIQSSVDNRWNLLKQKAPVLRLWHISGSENRKSSVQNLLTFHECSEVTDVEASIVSSQEKTIFTSKYSEKLFKEKGCENTVFIPLGFDEEFRQTGKKYLEGIVHFGLMGKFEKRKHTQAIIKAWLKKYGNNPKYQLTCLVNNPFYKPEQMQALWQQTTEGVNYNNLNILPHLATNAEVNELLNSIDIDLTGLSGGEGWNLPAFNATCLGKWSIVLNATSHKDWATTENSILIEPSGKMDCADGVFFQKGGDYNQGEFFTWTEEDVISAMEKAESKVGQLNTEGVKMGDEMTYAKTVDGLLSLF